MHITVSGASKSQAAQITQAAEFYASILLHAKTAKTVFLDIEVLDEYQFLGQCFNDDFDSSRPRWFTIKLVRQSDDKDTLTCLAHEMVHLKQFVKGELSQKITPTKGGDLVSEALWNGRPWKPKGKEHAYFDSPWEYEAHAREQGLYYRLLEFWYKK